MKNTHRIAVIAGDGIGKEVMPEGVRVLEKVAKKFDIGLQFDWFDFASCDYYAKHGKMMPEDWQEKIGKHDARANIPPSAGACSPARIANS